MDSGTNQGRVFSLMLRRFRVTAGLTQEELAQRSGLSVRTISDMERGRTARPYVRSVRLIADGLTLAGPEREQFIRSAHDLPGEPGLTLRRAGLARPVVPRQLPSGTAQFVGREAELKMLSALLDEEDQAVGTARIVVIFGTPGVGKTALALRWAHEVAGEFPDGQLYVNLRGFDPSGTPVASDEAVRAILDALQASADMIQLPSLDARAALYRSLVAGKRMLIVLDNARDTEQVRPLLPAAPGCFVIVTSRSQLTGLVAAEGASPIPVDLLTEGDARYLVARHLGHLRVTAEPQAVTDLVRLSARLPLALAISAACAATHPRLPLAALAAGLQEARDRLDAGEAPGSVRAVFSWSYQQLSSTAAAMFRLLGVHSGPDISAPAAASLTRMPADQARHALDELTRTHLLTEHPPGRFAFHDLLRAYAAEQAFATDNDAQRRASLRRALDHYLHTSHRAVRLLQPPDPPISLARPSYGTIPEQFTTNQQALAWFEAEHRVLLAAVRAAADNGFDTHAWQLPSVLSEFFARRAHYQDWATTQRTALAAARRLHNQAAQALSQRNLGDALILLGGGREAHAHLKRALRLYRLNGDHAGEGRSHFSIAGVFEEQGDYCQALRHAQQALHLCETQRHRAGEAYALNAVGWYYALLGDHQLAVTHCQLALSIHRELGDRFGEAVTLDSLACSFHRTGRGDEAIGRYQDAVTAYRDAGDRGYQAETLIHLGNAHRDAGNTGLADEAWQQALGILDDLDLPDAAGVRARLGLRNE